LSESRSLGCCFGGCEYNDQPPSLRLQIYPPQEKGSVVLWAHDRCFIGLCNPLVSPDRTEDHGHIPSKARCVFCGNALPIIGRHPYCFDVGDLSPPHRYWSHAQCLLDRVDPSVRGGL